MSSINIGSTESFNEITSKSNKLVLVDFWAQWCGPCKTLGPVLEEISNEHDDKVQVLKLDVDQLKEVAASYGIKSIPTMIFFKNGQIVSTLVGNQSKNEIVKQINELA